MSVADSLGLQDVELVKHSAGGAKGGTTLVRGGQALEGKTVGLYFSAHWCPPCRAFTPILAEVYRAVQTHKDFEIVFVSGDRDAAQAEEYFREMPWLAVPFEEHAVRQRLSQQFGVMGIPRLVIVGPDGEVIANDARGAVMSDRRGEHFPWRGSTGGAQGLAGFLLSPRGLLMLFLFFYWLSQWLSKKQ